MTLESVETSSKSFIIIINFIVNHLLLAKPIQELWFIPCMKIVSVTYLWMVFRQFTCTKLIPFGSWAVWAITCTLKTDIVIIRWLMMAMAAITFTSGFMTRLIGPVPTSDLQFLPFPKSSIGCFAFTFFKGKNCQDNRTDVQLPQWNSGFVLPDCLTCGPLITFKRH